MTCGTVVIELFYIENSCLGLGMGRSSVYEMVQDNIYLHWKRESLCLRVLLSVSCNIIFLLSYSSLTVLVSSLTLCLLLLLYHISLV